MSQHVTAIYEHGVLRPLEPVNLREQEVVSLAIQAVPSNGQKQSTDATLFEIFDEAGLVGCIENAPSDLSTNPQHLEGFGRSAVEGILIDSGPLVAILSRRDEHHKICVAEAKTLRGAFYTAWPVVTEAAYLLRKERGAVERLLSPT